MRKRIFAVSDIHGHYTLLKEALDRAGFDDTNEEHLLVGCGDYFDRGPENLQVLRYLERIRHKVLIRGNHEDLLLKLLQTGKLQPHHYINGSLQTIEQFFGKYCVDPAGDTLDFSGQTRRVDRLCDFIGETVNYFETKNYVFVHGWNVAEGDTAEARFTAEDAMWEGARWERWTQHYHGEAPIPGLCLVCGHVPTFYAPDGIMETADIYYGTGLIVLDAGTFDSKQVNVLVIEDEVIV